MIERNITVLHYAVKENIFWVIIYVHNYGLIMLSLIKIPDFEKRVYVYTCVRVFCVHPLTCIYTISTRKNPPIKWPSTFSPLPVYSTRPIKDSLQPRPDAQRVRTPIGFP